MIKNATTGTTIPTAMYIHSPKMYKYTKTRLKSLTKFFGKIVYAFVRAYACVFARVCVCAYVCVHMCVRVRACANVRVCVCVRTCVYVCACVTKINYYILVS
jgi:hypothetical protein